MAAAAAAAAATPQLIGAVFAREGRLGTQWTTTVTRRYDVRSTRTHGGMNMLGGDMSPPTDDAGLWMDEATSEAASPVPHTSAAWGGEGDMFSGGSTNAQPPEPPIKAEPISGGVPSAAKQTVFNFYDDDNDDDDNDDMPPPDSAAPPPPPPSAAAAAAADADPHPVNSAAPPPADVDADSDTTGFNKTFRALAKRIKFGDLQTTAQGNDGVVYSHGTPGQTILKASQLIAFVGQPRALLSGFKKDISPEQMIAHAVEAFKLVENHWKIEDIVKVLTITGGENLLMKNYLRFGLGSDGVVYMKGKNKGVPFSKGGRTLTELWELVLFCFAAFSHTPYLLSWDPVSKKSYLSTQAKNDRISEHREILKFLKLLDDDLEATSNLAHLFTPAFSTDPAQNFMTPVDKLKVTTNYFEWRELPGEPTMNGWCLKPAYKKYFNSSAPRGATMQH